MKVGLFGGSFNPIHKEHLRIIKYILNKHIVDEVWILPCKIHAFNKSLIPAKDRIKMIKRAIKNIDNVKICYLELKSGGKSYTTDTIKELKRVYKHQFYFIIGFDILEQIAKWYKHRQLFKEIEFIAFKRKNYRFKEVKDMKISYLIDWRGKSISSTMIRERAKKGRPIKGLVHPEVEKYISKHRIYKRT